MSDPAFTRPDLFSIPDAEQAELAAAVRGVLRAGGYPPAGNNPLAPLTGDSARTPAGGPSRCTTTTDTTCCRGSAGCA
jgi:hypothetical protein